MIAHVVLRTAGVGSSANYEFSSSRENGNEWLFSIVLFPLAWEKIILNLNLVVIQCSEKTSLRLLIYYSNQQKQARRRAYIPHSFKAM